jgi:uroporphyrinogen decarboxylase
MDSKERVIRAVEFDEPDRVPNGCYSLPLPLGPRSDGISQLFVRYPSDFAEVRGMGRYIEWSAAYDRGTYRDEWGIEYRNLQYGVEGQPKNHPLADWESLETYEIPDPLSDIQDLQESIRGADQSKYLLFNGGNLWQLIHALRGFENTLIDIMRGRKELDILIDKIVGYYTQRLAPILELDIDGVLYSDDWGTQQGLMLSPGQWSAHFRSAYKRLFDQVHSKGKHVFFHSDGDVMGLIPEWIGIGIDAINVQVSLMGIEETRRESAKQVCVAADVDRQHALPFGTTGEVDCLVRDIIRDFSGQGGGLILYGEVGPDVPLANAKSMLKALHDYGEQV